MAEARKVANHRSMKVPEFLKEPLEAAQARLEAFEDEAQRVWKELMQKGKESRKDIAELVQKLQKQDWYLPELQKRIDRLELQRRIEKLRETGAERAEEWRDRAETFRVEAMDRLLDLHGKAVKFLGVASREQVEELSRELERIVRRLEKGGARRRGKKAARRPSSETPQA